MSARLAGHFRPRAEMESISEDIAVEVPLIVQYPILASLIRC